MSFENTFVGIILTLDKYKRLPYLEDNPYTVAAEFYTLGEERMGKKFGCETELYKNCFYYESGDCGMPMRKPLKEGGQFTLQQHDDMVSLAARDKSFARMMIRYGIKHWGSFDQRTIKPYSFPKMLFSWTMVKEFLSTFRQPYQWAMMELGAWGVAEPIGYLHLLLTIIWTALLVPRENTSGKMLLWIFAKNTRGLGLLLAWIYVILIRLRWGDWEDVIWRTYYKGHDMYELFKDER